MRKLLCVFMTMAFVLTTTPQVQAQNTIQDLLSQVADDPLPTITDFLSSLPRLLGGGATGAIAGALIGGVASYFFGIGVGLIVTAVIITAVVVNSVNAEPPVGGFGPSTQDGGLAVSGNTDVAPGDASVRGAGPSTQGGGPAGSGK